MKKTLIGLMIALLCLGMVGMTVAIVNLNKGNESEVSEIPAGDQPQEESEPSEEAIAQDDSEEWTGEIETIDGKFATAAIEDLRFYALTTGGITVKSWEFKNLDTTVTIRDGLNFYAANTVNAMDEGAYTIEDGQINVKDDWFTAQVTKADGAKNFELTVTYSGMDNYSNNGTDGRIGFSFKNKSGKELFFDLVEQNKECYLARLLGEVKEEKGWTKQAVADEITLKLKRNGDQYTMTCGDQEWNFVISQSEDSSASTTNEKPVWTPPFIQD